MTKQRKTADELIRMIQEAVDPNRTMRMTIVRQQMPSGASWFLQVSGSNFQINDKDSALRYSEKLQLLYDLE